MDLFLKKLVLFLLIGLFLIIALVSLSFYIMQRNQEPSQLLYNYQIKKIKKETPVETIFVGDSSLGNSIDSVEFTRLSSEPTANLALTGLYGYAGSYNMLKTAYKYHPEIKNVIVMQTLDIQTREVSYDGYARTAGSLDDFFELNGKEKLYFIKGLYDFYIKSLRSVKMGNQGKLLKNDYIKQNKKIDFPDVEPLNPENINPKKSDFLLRIEAYCRKNGLNLIYVNGPIYEKKALDSMDYIKEVKNNLIKSGVPLVLDLVTIKNSDLGDEDDHVNSGMKKVYTGKYYELIKNKLR